MTVTQTEKAKPPRTGGMWLGLVALNMVLFLASLKLGPASIPLLDLLTGNAGPNAATLTLILAEIRLPRAILAVLVGGTLGLCGAVLQGLLRNPLAEPGLLGASSAAALGAVIVFYHGLAATSPLALPIGGIAGAMIGVLLILVLAGRGARPTTLILAGVAVNSLAGALTALALNLAPSPFASLEIVFWMLGSLADRSFEHVHAVLPFILLGWPMLLLLRRPLEALTLGEDVAASLGFDLRRLQLLAVLGTGLTVGACVSVAGNIGFVGLVVPHLLRPWVGHHPGRLIAPSALGGAALLLAADLLTRTPVLGQELKLGVVTALVGAPLFLHLLWRLRRRLL
jgi:iron complex transport system permease protein